MPEIIAALTVLVIIVIIGAVLGVRVLIEVNHRNHIDAARVEVDVNHEEMARLLADILAKDNAAVPLLWQVHRDEAQRLIAEYFNRRKLSR